MKILNNLPQIFGNISNDILKFIDKTDSLKEILQKDELLSSTSIGKVIQFFVKEAIKIADENEAFKSAIALVYLQTLLEAMEFHQVKVSNLGINEATNFDVTIFKIDSFFDNELVQFYETEYKRVLEENGVSNEIVTKLQSYIKDNAKINFFKLLEDRPIVYEELINYIKSDKSKEIYKKYLKEKYKATLEKEFVSTLLFENERGITLKDIYIEPNFKVYKSCFKKDDERIKNIYRNEDKGFIEVNENSIHDFVDVTLKGENPLNLDIKDTNIIFIFGYAGQGKSSFCKRFAYDAVSENIVFNRDIYLVKLKNINPLDLKNSPYDTIEKYLNDKFEIVPSKSAILLLDGLDELHMKSGFSSSDIESLCKDLIHYADNRKVIVTSRYGYIESSKIKRENSLILQLKELSQIQQIKWLTKYREKYPNIQLTIEKLKSFHENKFKHILELIEQPILLHMIANIDIEIENDLKKSKLYDTLFNTLIERKCSRGGQLELLYDITKEDLRELIQDIAIAIYQSDREYIHKTELLKLDTLKEFNKKLSHEAFEESIKGLMIAFYFQDVKKEDINEREDDRDNDYAIEFLHKSLMEYMVAEKIWDSMNEFLEKKRKNKFMIDDFAEALELLSKLFSKKLISNEIVEYLIEIIESDKSIDKEVLTDRLENFFSEMLERDFLYEFKINDTNPIDKGLNTFYGFWTILSHISEKNHIEESFKEKFGYIVNFINKRYDGAKLNLSHQNLSKINFEFTIFNDTKFIKAILNNTNMSYSYLLKADLSEANLGEADLRDANLTQADLRGTNLRGTNLRGTNLRGTNLSGTNLRGTNLRGTDLSGTDLSETNLRGADLSGTNLRGADLREADLEKADLSYANLREADLSYANLREADLREANYLMEAKNLDEAIGIPEKILKEWKEFNNRI